MSSAGEETRFTNTAIDGVGYQAFWRCKEKVENVFVESKISIDTCITLSEQWIKRPQEEDYTDIDPPILLGEEHYSSIMVPTSKRNYAELLVLVQEPDKIRDLGLYSKFEGLIVNNRISSDELHSLEEHLTIICSKVVALIMKEKPKNILVKLRVVVIHTILCDVQEFNDRFMDEELHDFKLVPAAPSYVEALEIKQYDKENSKQESCLVCLEKFLMAENVTLMPCSHIFHNECIKRWLEMKNTCPMCRFTLPTLLQEES